MKQHQKQPATIRRRRQRRIPPGATAYPFKQYCEQKGVAYKSGRAAVFAGQLAIIKIGNRWYVRPSEFEKFLDANTVRFGI